MARLVSLEDALSSIRNGMVVMIGGFLGNGIPSRIIDGLAESKISGLTIISNDSGVAGKGVARLIERGCCKKIIASYIGACPETAKRMNNEEMEVELVPQGTLAERIRASGSGLGGVLTPTGIGTFVEDGKRKLNIDGQDYLLERPIKANVALLGGSIVDKAGNVFYRKSTRNFNPLMAMAADLVIVEARCVVDVGEIEPESVITPGILVDMIVDGGDE